MKKQCPKCRKALPLSAYHAAAGRKDGRNAICKRCRSDTSKNKTHDYAGTSNKIKSCTSCGRRKKLSTGFYRHKDTPDGYYTKCKDCHKIRVKAWATKNPELLAAKARKWREANKEKLRRQRQARDLEKKYGLTAAQYDALVAGCSGCCQICGKTPKRLVVDHCHDTGAVRGLLCSVCNIGLGMLCDDVAVLRNAVKYLLQRR